MDFESKLMETWLLIMMVMMAIKKTTMTDRIMTSCQDNNTFHYKTNKDN